MKRREYNVDIRVNERSINKIIIDPHYELKHSDSVTDDVIIELVHLLDGGFFPPEERTGAYEYYVTDKLRLDGKLYKLIWLLEDDQLYIGVVNAYRRKNGVSKRKGS